MPSMSSMRTADQAKRQRSAKQVAAAQKQAFIALGEFIHAQRQLAQLSLRELATKARVSNPYLSQLERGMYRPSAQVLRSIAGALGLDVRTMFTVAGFIDDRSDEPRQPTVERAISL